MVIRVYITKDGNVPLKGKGHLFTNFIGTLDMFLEYPEMIVIDDEYDVKAVKNFCNENGIKLYILPI
jgi:hypothetical protein